MGRFPDIPTGYCRRAGLSIADPVCRDHPNSFRQRDPPIDQDHRCQRADDTVN
jgi:hypothetical protein